MTTILRFTVGSILAANAVFCQPKDVQGWDKVKWGMSVAEVRTAYGDRASEPTAEDSVNGRVLKALRADGFDESSEAVKLAKQFLKEDPSPTIKLIVRGIHIGGITTSADIY